jgi:hypothetical protein
VQIWKYAHVPIKGAGSFPKQKQFFKQSCDDVAAGCIIIIVRCVTHFSV